MQNHSTSSWLDALTTALGPVIWGSTYIVTTELLPPDRPFTEALLFVAAYRLPGGVAAVVGAIGPLVVMGLVWALDHRRPPGLALAAGALGVLGMAALLLSPGARWDMVGVGGGLGGTVCMGGGTGRLP